MPRNLSASRVAAWRGLITVQANVVTEIEKRLVAANLPPLGWYDVLFALHEQPEKQLRMSELAEKVLLSRSGLTRLVDRLEREGCLRREVCTTDKRGFHVVLTPVGMDILRKIWPVYREGIADLFARHLTDNDVTLLNELWAKTGARRDG